MWRGEFAEAEKLAAAGAQRASTQPESPTFWRFRLLSAEIAILRRDFAAAQPSITAQLSPQSEFDALRARQMFLEAKVEVANGRFQSAREALEQGRRLAPPHSEISLDLDQLDGQALMRMGKWNDADAVLNRVISRAAAASDGYHEALALNDLGMGRMVRNRYDDALPYFERVVSLADLSGLSVYAASLNNAGTCYQRLGQFDRALAVQQRAFEVYEHRGKREDFVQALGEMGMLYLLHGEARKAQPFLKRAFDEAMAAKLLPYAALWASNLASADMMLGEWDEAERFNGEAMRLKVSLGTGRVFLNALVSAGIAEGRGQLDEARQRYEEALEDPEGHASIRWSAHAGLASVALKSGNATTASGHFEAALNIIEKTRSDLLKTDYKLSYLTQLISFYRDYVDALLAQGRTERALEVADSSRGQVLAERQHIAAPPRASAARLRRLAAESRTVFLAYWLAPSKSHLWVVSTDGIRHLTLPASLEIERLVREHQGAIANAMVDPLHAKDSAGDRLYRLLVAPAAPSLPPGVSVIIVPDGALHGINFETLPVDGPRRHYWIEDAQVQVAPSLASLTTIATASQASRSALIIGNPTPHPPEFPALAYAPSEMASVSKHFGSDHATSYEGDRASPASYRDARPERFAYVHFAAHATANQDSPLDSAVILSGPDNGYKLYARDVAALPLAADLVTVSACRSAGERTYSGEGLVGFAWAFLRAGARRVIAGLWDVDDRSTAELMDRLYGGLADGETPSASLRKAKLALIQEGGSSAAPYAWGAFQLFTVVP